MKKWKRINPLDVVQNRTPISVLVDQINQRMVELFPGEDEPKPEPAPEYLAGGFRGISGSTGASHPIKPAPTVRELTCQVEGCGEPWGFCDHGAIRSISAANRRIAELTKERDEARAQAIRDTKDAAAKALESEFHDWAGGTEIANVAVRIVRELEVGP